MIELKVKAGRLVRLKSGGPLMTVDSIRDQSDGIISCEWFDGDKLCRDVFDAQNLVLCTFEPVDI